MTGKSLSVMDSLPSQETLLDSLKDITAGAVRGIAQVFVGHPLDTIKVRLQSQRETDPRFTGVIDCIRKTARNEGLLGFYKGAQSPLYMSGFYSAILFLTYGQTKKAFAHDQYNGGFTLLEMTAIGVTSGVVAASIEGPMDLVKSKMQIQYQQYSGKLQEYKSSFDCARKLIKTYGISSIFRGTDAAILRNIPGTVLYFYVYEKLRYVFSQYEGGASNQSTEITSKNALSPMSVICAGGISGVLFWAAIFPFDVVKSRLQTDSVVPSQRRYKNMWHCWKSIYRTEGISAFYRGFNPCIIRAFPTNAASFLAFEYSRKLLG